MAQGETLSAALSAAISEGLCEPDPREDLNGLDVRRKVRATTHRNLGTRASPRPPVASVPRIYCHAPIATPLLTRGPPLARDQVVVLARELGLELEMEDVPWEEPLLPAELSDWQPDTSEGAASIGDQIVEALRPYDEAMGERVAALCTDGKVPVQLCAVDMNEGTASISLTAVDADSRVARCSSNENIVEIESRRYSRSPMVLQGPGAGAGITASGLFADVLHLSRTLVDWNIPSID